MTTPLTSPTIESLPPPPPGRNGWPWTEGFPHVSVGSEPTPRVSIVTPSYNHAEFIEETIRSVLLQGYPNLEYIIMDGGSTDSTVEIIKKYEPWLTYWRSHRDEGQAASVNEGFQRATGAIFGWLNSDDMYEPGALHRIAAEFVQHPEAAVVLGRCAFWTGGRKEVVRQFQLREYQDFLMQYSKWRHSPIIQPEAFFTPEAFEKSGRLPTDARFCFDVLFWIHIARNGGVFHSFDTHIANLRRHPAQITQDMDRTYAQLTRRVWALLLEDWDKLGSEAKVIANDLFMLLAETQANYEQALHESRSLPHYRLAKRFASVVPLKLKLKIAGFLKRQ